MVFTQRHDPRFVDLWVRRRLSSLKAGRSRRRHCHQGVGAGPMPGDAMLPGGLTPPSREADPVPAAGLSGPPAAGGGGGWLRSAAGWRFVMMQRKTIAGRSDWERPMIRKAHFREKYRLVSAERSESEENRQAPGNLGTFADEGRGPDATPFRSAPPRQMPILQATTKVEMSRSSEPRPQARETYRCSRDLPSARTGLGAQGARARHTGPTGS